MGGRPGAAAVTLLAWACACSAPATPRAVIEAERLERGGRDDDAARAYQEAADAECGRRERERWCAAALDGQAAALVRLGRKVEAADLYETVPAAVPGSPDAAARALVAAASLRLELGDERRGYDLYWRALVQYPDESAAEDALRHLVADGRRRNPRQLHQVLGELHDRLGASAVGDNLLYAMAELAEVDLGDDGAAIEACDRLAAQYPRSPLRDDALWMAARLARARHDPEGALRRLRALLATRESSFLIGSYDSVWLDDAQLEVGLILRDDLRRPRQALVELERVGKDYPDSVLRDDALVELAATHAALGDRAAACQALAELARRFPDSKYRLERAPALARKLECTVRT